MPSTSCSASPHRCRAWPGRRPATSSSTASRSPRAARCCCSTDRPTAIPGEYGPDADALDVTRRPDAILTFSYGAHHCLGAAAARLQGRRRARGAAGPAPDFEVDTSLGDYAPGSFVRRLQRSRSRPMPADRRVGPDQDEGGERWTGRTSRPRSTRPSPWVQRQLGAGHGEAQVGEAAEQGAEGDAAFEAGQRRAEAEVDAVAEAEVAARRAGRGRAGRARRRRRVAVGGRRGRPAPARPAGIVDAVERRPARWSPGTWRGAPGASKRSSSSTAPARRSGRRRRRRAGRGGRAGRRRRCRSGWSWCRGRPRSAGRALESSSCSVSRSSSSPASTSTLDEVVGRCAPLVGDERGPGSRRSSRTPPPPRAAARRVHGREQRAERSRGAPPGRRRDAEQLADDARTAAGGRTPRRGRPTASRPRRLELGRAARRRSAAIAGRSAATRGRRRRGPTRPPQPGVVGRIHGQHVAGERGSGQALGHDLGVTGQGGEHVLGQPGSLQRLRGPRRGRARPRRRGRRAAGPCCTGHRRPGRGEVRERVVADVGVHAPQGGPGPASWSEWLVKGMPHGTHCAERPAIGQSPDLPGHGTTGWWCGRWTAGSVVGKGPDQAVAHREQRRLGACRTRRASCRRARGGRHGLARDRQRRRRSRGWTGLAPAATSTSTSRA